MPASATNLTPKLVIEKFADGTISCLKLSGTIDEAFEGKKLGQTVTGDVLLVDLGAVKKISSFGIREWVDFIGTAAKQAGQVFLIECAPKVVDQLNMVANFTAGGRVFSFYAPFRCDYCDSEQRVLLQVDRDHETIKTMKLAERPCPSCKESMYFDDDGATFFSYILGQTKFELPPAVVTFLATKLHYAVDELERKLRIDKVIEGRTTLLRLAGDLDASFPREKLVDGLEGTVVVDLDAIGRIQPAGAAEWRSFVQQATPLVECLYFTQVPPAMLEKVCRRDDLGPKAQVLSLALPYNCPACSTTSAQLIDVAAQHAVLKFATAPELRCPTCKGPLACVAGEAVMMVLPGLPKPTPSAEATAAIVTLRDRALAAVKRRSEPLIDKPVTAPSPPPPRSMVVPLLVATLGLVLVAILVVGYVKLSGRDPTGPTGDLGSAQARTITGRSAAARPPWADRIGVLDLVGEGVPAASCEGTQRITCAGMSALAVAQGDAEDEAVDVALEALAHAIAQQIREPRWKQAVEPIYTTTRDAKLAALARDPTSTTARRDVRDGRRAVARALRATAAASVGAASVGAASVGAASVGAASVGAASVGAASVGAASVGNDIAPTGRYWEEYTGGSGKRYVAFAEVTLDAPELAKLIAAYTRESTALGATVVDAFPLVAWRYPAALRGAIAIAIADGPLRTAGIPERSVVLAIDSREVGDGTAFARLAIDQAAALAKTGGLIALRVQTPDPSPREFTARIAPIARSGKPERVPTGGQTSGTGGVNTWDRYNGGSAREDPDR